jgi:hypothetical protein
MSLDPILTGACELQDFCQARGWHFCFIGAIAVQRWGEPRFTADADLTLLSGFGSEEQFIEPLCAHFRPRPPKRTWEAKRVIATSLLWCRLIP